MARCAKREVVWEEHEVQVAPTTYTLAKTPLTCPDPTTKDDATIKSEIKSAAERLARDESETRRICRPVTTCQSLPETTETDEYTATIRTAQWGERHTWTDPNGRNHNNEMCAYHGYEDVKFNLNTKTRKCAPRNNGMALISALTKLKVEIDLETLAGLSPHFLELVEDQVEKALLEVPPEDPPTDSE